MHPTALKMVTPGLLVWTVLPPERRAAVVSLLGMLAVRAAAGATEGGRDEPGQVPNVRGSRSRRSAGSPGPGCDRLRPPVQQAAGA